MAPTTMAPMRTVLVSALVAAFVTLLVEYFAKPSLEARKDRILQRNRDARARGQALVDIVKWLGVAESTPASAHAVVLPMVRKHLENSAEVLMSTPLDLTLNTNRDAVRLTSHFTGYVLGHLSGEITTHAFASAAPMAAPLADYYYAPQWRLLYRRRRLREASAAQPGVTSGSPA